MDSLFEILRILHFSKMFSGLVCDTCFKNNIDRIQISHLQFLICKTFWQFANEFLHFF